MPKSKYVLKEDVEKGLVDPTKTLEDQPEYKQKIQQQAEAKQKQFEAKHPQPQRPKKERPPRNQRPVFNWNKQDVTEATKPPEKPKKLLEKPDREKHQAGLDKLKAERQDIKDEKKALIEEQKKIIRFASEAQKSGKQVNSEYSGELGKKFEVQRQLRRQIKALDETKVRVNRDFEALRFRIDGLRKPNSSQNLSAEVLQKRIVEKQQYLTMGELNKRDQARLNNEINQLKRALPRARGQFEIDADVGKLQDQADILYKELKGIKYELHLKITEANVLKEQINQLKESKESHNKQKQQNKSVEQIRAEFDIKIKAVEAKRDKLQERIDDYLDKHTRDVDNYEDQQDLLRYIKWVEDQQERLKKHKQQEEKRKKEAEQLQKKRQKEYEEREKKRQQRRKAEEQRKVREQERKLKLQKEKEQFINRNPNYQQIQSCDTLISYCRGLRPTVYKREQRVQVQASQVTLGKQWQKEVKGGAVVLVSKKSKEDEDSPVKKNKNKVKAKQQKQQDQTFSHNIDVVNQFQNLNLLPPNKQTDIDSTIQLIRQKLNIFNQPSEQDRAAFREKAIKEWEQKQAAYENRARRDGGYNRQRDGQYKEREGGKYKEKEGGQYRQKVEDREDDQDEERLNKPQRNKPRQQRVEESDFPEI